MNELETESKSQQIRIPCSNCGNESDKKNSWHLRHNINFCSEDCVYDFIEEFMILTYDNAKKSDKKLKMLENRINKIMNAMKTRKKKK